MVSGQSLLTVEEISFFQQTNTGTDRVRYRYRYRTVIIFYYRGLQVSVIMLWTFYRQMKVKKDFIFKLLQKQNADLGSAGTATCQQAEWIELHLHHGCPGNVPHS